ncbi:MAG: hypothetical protein P8M22_01000 [Phycisphaerales bacterium]|nr:hypothetical protein [Phycisphaerales bacterium]
MYFITGYYQLFSATIEAADVDRWAAGTDRNDTAICGICSISEYEILDDG